VTIQLLEKWRGPAAECFLVVFARMYHEVIETACKLTTLIVEIPKSLFNFGPLKEEELKKARIENDRAAIETEFREKELIIKLEKKKEELRKFQAENAVQNEYREKQAKINLEKQEEELRMLKLENTKRDLENEKLSLEKDFLALEYSRKKRKCESVKNESRKRMDCLLSCRLNDHGAVTVQQSSSLDEDSTTTSSSSFSSPPCTASHSSSRSLSLSNEEQENLLVAIANATGCSAEDARVVNGCIILFISTSVNDLQLISIIEVTLKYLYQLRRIEVNERILVEVLKDPTQILRLFHYLFLSNECDIFYRNSAAAYVSENEVLLMNDNIGNFTPSTIVLIVIESAAVESLLKFVRNVTAVSYSCFFVIEEGSTYLLLEFVEDGKMLAYFSSILSSNFGKTCVLMDSAVDANLALFGCLARVSCACRYTDL
jgi:hypothetical protein